MNAADRFVAISKATAMVLVNRLAVASHRVVVIHPGIWPSRSLLLNSVRGRLDGFNVLSVGRLDLRKGHSELIEAIALLRRRGVQCTLRIVGEGKDRELIERQITERRLDGIVQLLGHQSDENLAAEYARADAFALLTRDDAQSFEGFGIVFLEAAQQGLPILAGHSGGSVEAVDPGTNAVIVENPTDAAEVLQRWANDPDECHRLQAGSLTWARHFDWSLLAEQYGTVLSDASTRNDRRDVGRHAIK